MSIRSGLEYDLALMEETKQYENVGRNESCPCGSGKKFKRCHGVNAEWKGNSVPEASEVSDDASESPANFDPSKMDLDWLSQFSTAMQRLPKGQLQQLQSLMQKAMAGKNVTREMEALQKKLPPSFQEMLKGSPELEAQMNAAQTNGTERAELSDEQKEKLRNIQKNNQKSGISKLWSKFKK